MHIVDEVFKTLKEEVNTREGISVKQKYEKEGVPRRNWEIGSPQP